ncbi:DUF309 domain-containing protein [Kitasatospora sp. NPDC094015]|uniref:DUF309 domain-containing protein n=1 Tax=Kitasatospora sp. NPDC094015 TaxID=3155205 RepID=UPI003324DEF1
MSDAVDEGGESACWLDRVCDDCGRLRERPGPTPCEHCGATPDTGPPPPPAVPLTTARADRDRDATGRARNSRPRDGLGRPLPYGRPGVERQPEGVLRAPLDALAEAQRLLDAGRPFHAHEVLEDSWKSAPEPERALWRALAQYAVGLTHAARGNETGARALLARAAAGLTPYRADPPYAIDADGLAGWATAQVEGRRAPDPAGAPPLRHR